MWGSSMKHIIKKVSLLCLSVVFISIYHMAMVSQPNQIPRLGGEMIGQMLYN